jgi:heme exporter protein D
MWTALIRQVVLFIFTRRGKRVLTFIGLMLLCFLTALLFDSEKYLTAGFTGVLTIAALIGLAIQSVRNRKHQRERERQEQERAERRAASAQARTEKVDRAKATVAGAAKAAGSSAASVARAARASVGGAR